MYKTVFVVLLLWVSVQGYAQTRHVFSLGGGPERMYNSYLSPYNLKGIRFVDVRYSTYKTNEGSKWESVWDIDLGVSSLNLDFDFANKLQKGPADYNFDLSAGKKYLYEFWDMGNLSVSAGGTAAVQSRFQLSSFFPIEPGSVYAYFMCGASAGVAMAENLRFKKLNIRNSSSCSLLNAMLLPNYTNDLPFSGNGVHRYLSFPMIGRRISLTNEFKVEFPLFIKSKLINSYSLSYSVNYENFESKGILYRSLSQAFSLGVVFTTQKVNVLAR